MIMTHTICPLLFGCLILPALGPDVVGPAAPEAPTSRFASQIPTRLLPVASHSTAPSPTASVSTTPGATVRQPPTPGSPVRQPPTPGSPVRQPPTPGFGQSAGPGFTFTPPNAAAYRPAGVGQPSGAGDAGRTFSSTSGHNINPAFNPFVPTQQAPTQQAPTQQTPASSAPNTVLGAYPVQPSFPGQAKAGRSAPSSRQGYPRPPAPTGYAPSQNRYGVSPGVRGSGQNGYGISQPAFGASQPGMPMGASPAGNVSVGPTATILDRKAYSDYQRPSAYSPYMELYRGNNSLGTIDNYHNRILPMQQQQMANQQLRQDIRATEAAARVQAGDLHRLRQQTNMMQGAPAQQGFFQNHTPYYPTFGN